MLSLKYFSLQSAQIIDVNCSRNYPNGNAYVTTFCNLKQLQCMKKYKKSFLSSLESLKEVSDYYLGRSLPLWGFSLPPPVACGPPDPLQDYGPKLTWVLEEGGERPALRKWGQVQSRKDPQIPAPHRFPPEFSHVPGPPCHLKTPLGWHSQCSTILVTHILVECFLVSRPLACESPKEKNHI